MTDILDLKLGVSPDAATSALGDETVILHLVNGVYYGLDPVGTRIWELIKQGVATREICRLLAEEYEVDRSTIEADARRFLTDMESRGILVGV